MCNTKLVQKLAFAYLLANTLADLSLQVSHRTRKHPESAHLRRRWPYLSIMLMLMSMWSSRWHFTIKSVTGAPYSIKSYGLSQLDTMVKSTMTETVVSWGRGGTAAAMAQNEQTTLASSQRWVGNVWSCDRSPRDRHTFYPATKFVLSLLATRLTSVHEDLRGNRHSSIRVRHTSRCMRWILDSDAMFGLVSW